jgi:hypothetical protein
MTVSAHSEAGPRRSIAVPRKSGIGATEPFGTRMTEVRNPTLSRLLNRPVGPGFVSSRSTADPPPLGTRLDAVDAAI